MQVILTHRYNTLVKSTALCSRRLLIVLFFGLLCPVFALDSKRAPAAKPWEKLTSVSLKPNRWNDGDSFHVTTKNGRPLILRLYFVDTCEKEKAYAARIRDQAAYFGITANRTKALADEATAFTRKRLAKPFTVHTRWRKALGRSNQSRQYAMIITADGKDLGKELVKNGLARIYGTRTVTWDNRLSKTYRTELAQLETKAKSMKLGGWKR